MDFTKNSAVDRAAKWGLCAAMCAALVACNGDDTGSSDGTATSSSSSGSTSASGTGMTSDPTGATTTDGGSESNSASESVGTSLATETGSTSSDVTTAGTSTTDSTTMGVTEGTSSGTEGTTTGGGPCMSSDECEDGQVCVLGECVDSSGPCDEYADCQGDTFCCKDDCLPPGEAPGACIPFGLEPEGEVNEMCLGEIQIGFFEPDEQCAWTQPPPGDPFPNHRNVLTTALVADMPSNGLGSSEIIMVTYNFTDGGAQSGYGSDPNYFGVIRIIEGRTCAQIETVHDPNNKLIAATPPAIADLDGDGVVEIVSHRASTGVIAFKFDNVEKKYKTFWVQTNTGIINQIRWDGPSIHDLNDDGIPEVISGSAVFDGPTGARLNPGQIVAGAGAGVIPVLGDVDGDGKIELIGAGVHRWNDGTKKWDLAYPGSPGFRHYGIADFGTPGATPADFDRTKLDGKAEIVTVGSSLVRMYTLSGQMIFSAPTSGGGPPTIGDFDNDGFPEIASAGGTYYAVYDLDCKDPGPGCQGGYIRWQKTSKDASSATTGSSIFDFEGDGQAEAVYADECYTRVYDGKNGEVLYSSWTSSCTWYENPVVADVDNDQNTEIVVGANPNCGVSCPALDPIHRGIRCQMNEECPSNNCNSGFCRCAGNNECPTDHTCTAPLQGTPGAGNTCRSSYPNGAKKTGVRVLKDRLDRWASSRSIWNQHAYSITNVLDDGTVPKTSSWKQNWADPSMNNFRQNAQGDVGAEAMPDVTSEFPSPACVADGGKSTLSAEVCNRGLKSLGAGLKTAFYGGDPEVLLCVATTEVVIAAGECVMVSCSVDGAVSGKVRVEGNDDGMGAKTALECITTNNGDVIDPIVCE
jgi:hypothetical protein